MLHTKTKTLQPLDAQACQRLADTLGEAPGTAMCYNALRTGQCIAFAAAAPAPLATVIELNILPGEPAVFATDATALWGLLQHLEGWHCVLAQPDLARSLGQLMQAAGQPVRYYQDIAYALHNFTPQVHPAVLLLTLQDVPLLLAATSLSTATEAQHTALLQQGLVAGAVVDGVLVALANVDSPTGHYAEIGVATAEAHRRQGYAAAAASLVIQHVLAQNRIPAWSTGEDNHASQRMAHKLGFVESRRSLYVIRAVS